MFSLLTKFRFGWLLSNASLKLHFWCSNSREKCRFTRQNYVPTQNGNCTWHLNTYLPCFGTIFHIQYLHFPLSTDFVILSLLSNANKSSQTNEFLQSHVFQTWKKFQRALMSLNFNWNATEAERSSITHFITCRNLGPFFSLPIPNWFRSLFRTLNQRLFSSRSPTSKTISILWSSSWKLLQIS